MKWKEILLKAWEYIKKYRALWYLGLLAALAGGGSGVGNFSNFDNIKGGSSNISNIFSQISNWISGHGPEVAVLVVALILICLIIFFASYSARAGLVYSVNKAESGEGKPEFHSAFHTGQKYFWRLLGLSILIAIMIFAVIFVLLG
jgi:uncharacterized membrane protein YjgN (DUF898 family)